MAALIEKQTGTVPHLEEGGRGEFTIWVDDECVAKKSLTGFPSDEDILKAVGDRLDAVGHRRQIR